ncbi:MAG: hypothetical protein JXR18_11350 [Neptuniibacter sp.]
MPCLLALYELQRVKADSNTIDTLTSIAAEKITNDVEDGLYLDRSFSFLIQDQKVYLQILLGPNESTITGVKFVEYLGLSSAKFVNDMSIYEAVNEKRLASLESNDQ